MTPATPPETELTQDLIDRVMKLSPENKDKLLGLLEEAEEADAAVPHLVQAGP